MAYPSTPDPSNDPNQPPPYGRTAGQREIEADIEHTRSQMDHTLDVLAERLRPRNLMRDAMSGFRRGGRRMSRHAPSRETFDHWGHEAYDQARTHQIAIALSSAGLTGAGIVWLLRDHLTGRHNTAPDPVYGGSYVDARTGEPYDAYYGSQFHTGRRHRGRRAVPTALTGAGLASGLAWMLGRGRWHSSAPPEPMHSGSYVDARTGRPYDEATYGREFQGGGAEGRTHAAGEKARSAWQGAAASARGAAASARDRAGGAWGAARHRMDSARHSAGDWSEQARHRMSEARYRMRTAGASAWNRTRHRVHSAEDHLQESYMYSREYADHTVQDYPLAACAVALGAGMLLGYVLPHTRREDQWMGDSADHLRRRAWEAGEEAYERGKQTVYDTAGAVSDEAERQGLTAGQLGERARRAVGETRASTEEAAEHQGLSPADLKQKAKNVAEEGKREASHDAEHHTREMKSEPKRENP